MGDEARGNHNPDLHGLIVVHNLRHIGKPVTKCRFLEAELLIVVQKRAIVQHVVGLLQCALQRAENGL